jgi:Raf kinase inhibitor-like YbhB/YbcL family protein
MNPQLIIKANHSGALQRSDLRAADSSQGQKKGKRFRINSIVRRRYAMQFRMLRVLGAISLFVWFGGQNHACSETKGGQAMSIEVKSTAFTDGGMIPKLYTCQGKDISPPLSWTGVPAEAKSLALIMDDPDAPRGTWVHWVVYNIPPDSKGLDENVPRGASLSNGAKQGKNSWPKSGYGGPCPPSGTHRYYFKVYALDIVLPQQSEGTKADILKAMKGHILAEGQLMGTYSKK